MTLLIKGTNIAEYELKEGVKQKLLLNRHETGDSRLEIRKIIIESKQTIQQDQVLTLLKQLLPHQHQ